MFNEDFQDYDFPLLGLVRLPEVKIEDKDKELLGLNSKCSNYQYLCALADKGFAEHKHKLNPEKLKEYHARMIYELEIFEELGFTDYVLLVDLVIKKLRDLGGFVDFGRGSCGGSFVFALLGITGCLSVIEKGLLFERFISRIRSKKQIIDGITYLQGDLIADADLNLGDKRPEIVEWLKTLYGGKICKIAAFSSLTGKILIKDTYKSINEVNEDEAKRVADLVEKHFGLVADIGEMADKNEDFKEWTENFPKTYQCALELRDLLRQSTSHPSGYFISFYDLDGFVPLELNKDKELTLAYEMNNSAKLGTKLDLLGLTTNKILTEFFSDIPEKLDDIELENNPIIYNQFQNNNLLPYGLYQINADCAYRVVNKVKPKNILELSDINAISRPGALDYLDSYVEGNAKSPHKIFDDIVKETRGLFLYQEQLIKALVAIGFSLDESELCRKIVGKKQVDKVKEWEQKIKDKVKQNNLPKEIGDILWKVLNESAKYSFNKSHSFCTAKLGALTVWAKYKHPLEFYKSCLNSVKELPNPIEEISLIQKELSIFNIKLLPPHILKSENIFKIENGNIRYALSSIKGISDKTLEKLRNFCHPYSNKLEIFEAANECKLNIAVTSNIIAVGSMDDYLTDNSRAMTILELFTWNLLTTREKERAIAIGKDFNYSIIDIVKYLSKPQEGSEKPFIKAGRLETIRRDFKSYNEMYKQNSKNEELANFCNENAFLGFSYSHKLIDILKKEYPDIIPINQAATELDETKVKIGGQVSDLRAGVSKNKNKYIKIKLYDGSGGSFNAMIMERNFAQNDELNNGRKLENGDIVMVDGSKKGDIIFANRIVSQNIKILSRPENKVVDKTTK